MKNKIRKLKLYTLNFYLYIGNINAKICSSLWHVCLDIIRCIDLMIRCIVGLLYSLNNVLETRSLWVIDMLIVSDLIKDMAQYCIFHFKFFNFVRRFFWFVFSFYSIGNKCDKYLRKFFFGFAIYHGITILLLMYL